MTSIARIRKKTRENDAREPTLPHQQTAARSRKQKWDARLSTVSKAVSGARCRAPAPRPQNKNGETAHSTFLDVARGRNPAVAGNPRCIREIARLSPRTRRGGVTPAAHGNPRRVFSLLCAPLPPQALYADGGRRFCRRCALHAFSAYKARQCAVERGDSVLPLLPARYFVTTPCTACAMRRYRRKHCMPYGGRCLSLPQTRPARIFCVQGTSI